MPKTNPNIQLNLPFTSNSNNRTNLGITLFIVFLDVLGFSLLIPVLPSILTDPTSGNYLFPIGFDNGTAILIYGVLMGVFPLVNFFFSPILGQLSDKFGRRKILFWSLLGTFVAYLLLAIGITLKNLPLIFLSRIFGGIAGGNISVANTVISDISIPANKSRNFAWVSASYGLGLIFGSYFGGLLSSPSVVSWFDATTPFWFASIVSLALTTLVYFVLPETNMHIQNNKILKWNESILEIFKAVKQKSTIQTILIVSFFFQCGFSFVSTFASAYFVNKLNWQSSDTGNFFGYIGICVAITQVFLVHNIAKFHNEKIILRFSLFATAVSIVALFLPTSTFWLYAIIPFFAVFSGLCSANITAMVSGSTTKEKQGEVIGINSGLQSLAQAIPAIVSGLLSFGIELIAQSFGFKGGSLALATPIFLAFLTILGISFYMKNHFESF